MSGSEGKTVAVVGTGVIGRSWIRVFTRAGREARVYDLDPARSRAAVAWARASARQDEREGFVPVGGAPEESHRIVPCSSLDEALDGATWVQESGPEDLDMKRRLYRELDERADPGAILASSTSALDMTRIAEGLAGASRCIVAHPVNPPHVVPVVEVLPGAETAQEVVTATLELLTDVGQSPVLVNRFVPGFLLNRMQAALVREAVSLIGSGVASADAIDAVVRDGLGLRWALMGPFGTGHTNADGGVGDYYRRYGAAYRSLWDDLDPDPDFSDAVIDRIHEGTEAIYGPDATRTLAEWRDRVVRRIRALKVEDPPPSAD